LSLNTSEPQRGQAGVKDQSLRPRDGRPCDAATNAQQTSEAQIQAGAARLTQEFSKYGADNKRSALQFATTFTLFLALLAIMAVIAPQMYWLALLLAPLAAGLLVRLFIFQHDCGHGSFFTARRANDIVGRVLSVFTLTPYDHWRRSHAQHHATSGNLDRRGVGDVPTLTVNEYLSSSFWSRLGYRLFRNPVIMILIGAPINFIVLQRIPRGRSFTDRNSRNSFLLLNLALAVVFGIPMALFGVQLVLSVYLPVMIMGAWAGGWLFYVQHQFEGAYWWREKDWDFRTASLVGSSYFDLPPILQWFTGNIGLHHIHHLCCRIPNYQLQPCLDAFSELHDMSNRITLRDSLHCGRLALWDEELGHLVSFRDVASRPA